MRKRRATDRDLDDYHLACDELDAAADGVQVIDLEDWRRQDATWERQTRQMVADIRAGRSGKWEAKARAQMRRRRNG